MKILRTNAFLKISANWDDQPNFVQRDHPGTFNHIPSEMSEEEVLKRFDPKYRKKRRKRPTKRIYQLGIDVPISAREQREQLDVL